MNSNITIEELIVEMMPFPKELINWCKSHPQFLKALKIIYSDKFISLGAVVTSYSPNCPNDEVIGVYTYDYMRKNPLFKQDFIINIGKQYKEFILYTRNYKNGSSKYVKDINDFYLLYGKGRYYINSHHLTFDQLPQEIKPRGLDAINLASKLKGKMIYAPEQEKINEIYNQVKIIKNTGGFINQKLKK